MSNVEIQQDTPDKPAKSNRLVKEAAQLTGLMALTLFTAHSLISSVRGLGISQHFSNEDIEELVIDYGYIAPDVVDEDKFMPGVGSPCEIFGSVGSLFTGDVVSYNVDALDKNGNPVDLVVCYDIFVNERVYLTSESNTELLVRD